MKRFLLLVAIFCSATICYSQTDFRNGYVITNARDTLFGLINYREGSKAFQVCDFKLSNDQPETTYAPADILGYGFVQDKFFASREVSMKDQPKKLVFLEVLVRGTISLYKFEDTFFVEKNGTDLYHLLSESKEQYIDGKRVMVASRQYAGILNMLLFDCQEMKGKSESVRLSEKELTKLIEAYNRCKGTSSTTFKEEKPWIKAIPAVMAGINISQLKFEHPPDYLAGAFELSKLPMVGVSVDVLSPRLSERISFHAGLYYAQSKYYSYSQSNTSLSAIRNYVTIELQQLKVPVGFRYTFPLRKFTPYATVGISGTWHLNSQAVLIQEVETLTGSMYEVETFKYEALSLSDFQFGGWGGMGLFRSISDRLNAFIEVRFEQTNGISWRPFNITAETKSSVSNYQLIFGIRFK